VRCLLRGGRGRGGSRHGGGLGLSVDGRLERVRLHGPQRFETQRLHSVTALTASEWCMHGASRLCRSAAGGGGRLLMTLGTGQAAMLCAQDAERGLRPGYERAPWRR